MSDTEARSKFGFLLDALETGAPPHGGIAFGLDRCLPVNLSSELLCRQTCLACISLPSQGDTLGLGTCSAFRAKGWFQR